MPHATRFQASRRPSNKRRSPKALTSTSSRAVSKAKLQIKRKRSQRSQTLSMLIRYSINDLTHSKLAPPAQHTPPLRKRTTERVKTRFKRFTAVNGVVMPSKVPLGQLPDQGIQVSGIIDSLYACSICARKFARKDNVGTHMWPCVQRNGNPNGVRWDDAWNHGVNSTGSSDLGPKYADFRVFHSNQLLTLEAPVARTWIQKIPNLIQK